MESSHPDLSAYVNESNKAKHYVWNENDVKIKNVVMTGFTTTARMRPL